MSRFDVIDTALSGLKIIQREHLGDERGFFSRLFCAEELAEAGWQKPISQINHTLTERRGTVRGMHFQHPPHAEAKIVTGLRGAVWDVAVDMRLGSPTLLSWHGEELTPENRRALLIPEGFAHGFQTLSADCELLYLHSVAYAPDAEGAVDACDPRLAIEWPLEITERSARDESHAALAQDYRGIAL